MSSASQPEYLAQLDTSVLQRQLCDVKIELYPDEKGCKRRLYSLGHPHRTRVVVLPPYGMSFLLVLRLAALLAERFNVLVWESGGCPDTDCEVVEADFGLAAQSRHFARILRQQGCMDFHFVGWCQSAQLAVHAVATEGLRPASMSWIAPAGFGLSLVKSEFERCALPIYLEIERQGREQAEKLARILNKYRDAPPSDKLTGERLTMLHLADPTATLVFSRYMKCYEDNKPVARELLAAGLNGIATQIIHCKDDNYSHYSESVQISRKYPGVELKLLDQGGHLQLFDAPEASAELVLRFIGIHEVAREAAA